MSLASVREAVEFLQKEVDKPAAQKQEEYEAKMPAAQALYGLLWDKAEERRVYCIAACGCSVWLLRGGCTV